MRHKVVRVSRKMVADMVDRFESNMDYEKRLDSLPFHLKREMAEIAATAAFDYLERLYGRL